MLFVSWCFGSVFMIFGFMIVNIGWIYVVENGSFFWVLFLVMIELLLVLDFVVGMVRIVLIGVVFSGM